MDVSAEQAAVEQQALETLANRQQQIRNEIDGTTEEVPDGYNEDGTPKEELIAGKFKSQEDLLKAYQELEKKLSEQKQPDTPKQEITADNAATTVEGFNQFYEEFNTTGSLSDASYEKLAKQGITKADVDIYIRGQQALATTFSNSVIEAAGGETAYNELIQWASTNVDKATIEEYNKAVQTLDTNKAKELIEFVAFKKSKQQPQEVKPNRLEGVASEDGGGIKPFSDKNEWYKATANRLYGKDVKYTSMVDRRYLASKRKGII